MSLICEIIISILVCILGIQSLMLHHEIQSILTDLRERLVRIEYNKNKQ
jgi:hypothetical protein